VDERPWPDKSNMIVSCSARGARLQQHRGPDRRSRPAGRRRRGACHLARHILQAPCRAVGTAVAEMSNIGQLRHAVLSYVSEAGHRWPDSVVWLPAASPSNTGV